MKYRRALIPVLLVFSLLACRVLADQPPAPAATSELSHGVWGLLADSLGLDDPRAPITIQGRVIIGEQEKSAPGSKPRGIKDVIVSDGAQVAVTDENGSYILPNVTPGLQRFVWVSVPSGYRATVEFYRRIPLETGDFSHDFALVPDADSLKSDHAFVHLTDTHGAHPEFWAGLTPDRMAFMILTGDLVNDGANTDSFAAFRKAILQSGVPIKLEPGNHDIYASGSGELVTRELLASRRASTADAARPADAEQPELYEDFFGPSYYSFGYGNRHYVMLNSTAEHARQREWLKQDLAVLPADREILVFQHYPPLRDELDFWKQYPVRAIFFGHTHADLVTSEYGILLVNTVGIAHARDLSPLTYRLVSFEGEKMTFHNFSPEHKDQAALPPLPVPTDATARPEIKPGEDWTHFKADPGRSGHSKDGAAAPWTLAWTSQLGGATYLGSPVLENGVIYVGTGDRENRSQSAIHAIDPKTGMVLWTRETGTFPMPTAAGNKVFVTDRNSTLMALKASSGEPLWQQSLGDLLKYRLYTPPTAADGRVYAGNGRHFGAWDAETGNQLWRMPDVGAGMWPTFSAHAIASNSVTFSVPGRGVYQLDAATGRQIWRAEGIPVNAINPSSPLVIGDIVVFNTQGSLVALKMSDGSEVWRIRSPGRGSSPVTDGEGVIIAGVSEVIKVSPANGGVMWRNKDLGAMRRARFGKFNFTEHVLASPAVAGGQVHIATTDGIVLSLDATDGTTKGQIALERAFAASPIISGNAMFLVSYDGTVFALVSDHKK